MAGKKKDALDQLIDKFVGGNPKRQAMLDEEIVNAEAAQLVYGLRKQAGLTQSELAKKVGTTARVICRMEQADYEGSLANVAPDRRGVKPEVGASGGSPSSPDCAEIGSAN